MDKKWEHAPKLSKIERDELQAIGACFQCKQKGHLSRDCPKFRTLRPSTQIHAAAAEIGNIDSIAQKLDNQRVETHLIELFRIFESSKAKVQLPNKKEVRKWLIPELKNAVPFKTDFFGVESYDPYSPSRFTIDKFDPTHLCLYDWHTGDDHLLTTELLAKSPQEIVEYIQKEKHLLILDNNLITKESVLKALKQTRESLTSSMVNLPSDDNPPPLITITPSETEGTEESDDSSEVSENYDANGVLQETYNQIADQLGDLEFVGDCQVLTVHQ